MSFVLLRLDAAANSALADRKPAKLFLARAVTSSSAPPASDATKLIKLKPLLSVITQVLARLGQLRLHMWRTTLILQLDN